MVMCNLSIRVIKNAAVFYVFFTHSCLAIKTALRKLPWKVTTLSRKALKGREFGERLERICSDDDLNN
jgi:hypothetical protein